MMTIGNSSPCICYTVISMSSDGLGIFIIIVYLFIILSITLIISAFGCLIVWNAHGSS